MTELPDEIIELQRLAFRYFVDHTNGKTGLVADNTREDSPCSIAATGLGFSCHPIAVANGWLKRADAAERVLTALRFFEHSPQGPEPDVTGYKGFYYHFLEMKDGRRAGKCELSTVDSAFAGGDGCGGGGFLRGVARPGGKTRNRRSSPPPPRPAIGALQRSRRCHTR